MGRTNTIDVNGSPMRIYADGPPEARGGVLVMVHGPGLDRFMEAMVDALALHGYAAVAPDVFHRQPPAAGNSFDETMARIGKLRDDDILADADAAVRHLRTLTPGRLGVTGFCMGGRNTYLLAGARPKVWSAACVYYGGNIKKAWGDGPSPFDRTDQIECPVLGLFGVEDTNPSPEDVIALDTALTGTPHAFHSYAGAGHAFMNFTNAERHRPAQALDAWVRMTAFFDSLL